MITDAEKQYYKKQFNRVSNKAAITEPSAEELQNDPYAYHNATLELAGSTRQRSENAMPLIREQTPYFNEGSERYNQNETERQNYIENRQNILQQQENQQENKQKFTNVLQGRLNGENTEDPDLEEPKEPIIPDMYSNLMYKVQKGVHSARQGYRNIKNTISSVKDVGGAGYAGVKDIVVEKSLKYGKFRQLFDFLQSPIAQKIFCIIGILLLGAIYKLATVNINTTRSNFLTYCVWAWIYLLIAMVVINYGYRLVFQ